MTRLILATMAVLALSELAPARAQFGFGPGYGYGYRTNFGFAVGGPRFRVSGFYGGFVRPPIYYGPLYGPPFGIGAGFGYNPFGPAPVGNPFFLSDWPLLYGPPVVAVPVPVPVVIGVDRPNANPPGDPTPEPLPLPLPKGDFFVITPKKGITAPEVKKEVTVPEVKRVAPRPPGPVIAFDPLKPKPPVRVEVADPDPKKESARLVKLGRESFAAGDYGRAAEFFERATTADPAFATAYFLHAQANFAVGRYVDAVERIREGLARDPNWPKTAFDPAEPYGDRPERFVVHLVALKKVAAANPNQGVLEFLLGYQLWFSGEKPDAIKFFRAAEAHLPAPAPVALFKTP